MKVVIVKVSPEQKLLYKIDRYTHSAESGGLRVRDSRVADGGRASESGRDLILLETYYGLEKLFVGL